MHQTFRLLLEAFRGADAVVNGKWANVKALSEPEVVEFPTPFGRTEVAYVGRPEHGVTE